MRNRNARVRMARKRLAIAREREDAAFDTWFRALRLRRDTIQQTLKHDRRKRTLRAIERRKDKIC